MYLWMFRLTTPHHLGIVLTSKNRQRVRVPLGVVRHVCGPVFSGERRVGSVARTIGRHHLSTITRSQHLSKPLRENQTRKELSLLQIIAFDESRALFYGSAQTNCFRII